MELLFSNNIAKEKKVTIDSCTGTTGCNTPPKKPQKLNKFLLTLFEQCVNSSIVAAIAAFSIWAADIDVSWEPPVISFGITFFTELRKYRNL